MSMLAEHGLWHSRYKHRRDAMTDHKPENAMQREKTANSNKLFSKNLSTTQKKLKKHKEFREPVTPYYVLGYN